MEDKLNIRSKILKHLAGLKHDVSSPNVTLICLNGKFKVNLCLVAGIYYLFEQILLKVSDEGPTVLHFPDLKTEELEISFLSLYQQNYEESVCMRWQKNIESDAKLNEVALNDFHNETLDDKENDIFDDNLETFEDPVTIQIMRKPTKLRVTCELCGKEFKKKSMKSHLEIVHGKNPEKIMAYRENITCELCGKEIRMSSMKKHLLCHASADKKEICSICGKPKANLSAHMANVHGIGGGPGVSCHVCGKLLKTKTHLASHMLIHEVKKPCTICGAQVKQMNLHMLEAHTPNDQKKHKCPDCGKGFYASTKLTQHRINVHLRDRPFPCRYGCEFRYNDSSNRNSHERKKHGGLFNKQTGPPASVTSTD